MKKNKKKIKKSENKKKVSVNFHISQPIPFPKWDW